MLSGRLVKKKKKIIWSNFFALSWVFSNYATRHSRTPAESYLIYQLCYLHFLVGTENPKGTRHQLRDQRLISPKKEFKDLKSGSPVVWEGVTPNKKQENFYPFIFPRKHPWSVNSKSMFFYLSAKNVRLMRIYVTYNYDHWNVIEMPGPDMQPNAHPKLKDYFEDFLY